MHQKSKMFRRLKASLWSLGTLMACGCYVFIWLRYNLQRAKLLFYSTCAGVVALVSFAYSMVSSSAHRFVTKSLYGIGALVATVCSGFFIHYSWTERMPLQDRDILPFLILLCLLATGAALAAWVGFFRFSVSESQKSEDVA